MEENTCLSKLKLDTENKINELKDKITSNKKLQDKCKISISDLENKKKEFETKKQENDNNKSLKENLTIKLDSLKEKLEDLKSRKEKLYEDYDRNVISEDENYNKSIISCNSLFVEKKNNANIVIENARKLYEDTKKELLSIESPQDNLIDCSDEIKRLEEIKTKYLEDISYNNAIKENNEKLLKEQKQDKITLDKVKSKLEQLKKSLSDYILSKEIMSKTFPNYALDKISDSLVKEINDFIESVYYKELNVKFEPNKNSLKMTYNLNGERNLPIVKLSGAETNLVDLSVVSVFNNRQKLNCLILDEVDSASSDETASKFLDILMELTERYAQTIIITHKKEMQNRLIQNGCNIIKL